MPVERVASKDEILAIILRHDFSEPGVHFFTPGEFSQQLGFMQHPAGKVIQPHVHEAVQRKVTFTQEVLFVRKGKLRVDFYSGEQEYIESRVLEAGDVVLLAGGGHGFEVLEELDMVEVKQGPYAEQADKVRFNGIGHDEAVLNEGPR